MWFTNGTLSPEVVNVVVTNYNGASEGSVTASITIGSASKKLQSSNAVKNTLSLLILATLSYLFF